jgi:2-dehydro-3-deoxygalactonokinase
MIEGDVILDFKTYMTGEFFQLLSRQSILSSSVTINNDLHRAGAVESFKKGVKAAVNSNLLNASFKVRSNSIFNEFNKKDNFNYLSGLLIGTELQDLLIADYEEICLASSLNLETYYEIALTEVLGLTKKVTILSRKLVKDSIIKGQYQIMKHNIEER